MKKIVSVLLCVAIAGLLFAGCSGAKTDKKGSDGAASDVMPTSLNTAEYTLYQNVFYNDQKADFDGKEAVKEGTFATIIDAYNNVTRYYVWGYNDQTKCCDWQWEIKLGSKDKIPANGSLVEVSGKYEVNEDALDGLWIVDPKITVKTEYKPHDYDLDLLTMDNTLERVEIINILQKSDAFEGKTICCYGRVKDATTLQDAYYDGSWEIPLSGDNLELPAFGTIIQVYGTVKNGQLTDCKIEPNSQY